MYRAWDGRKENIIVVVMARAHIETIQRGEKTKLIMGCDRPKKESQSSKVKERPLSTFFWVI